MIFPLVERKTKLTTFVINILRLIRIQTCMFGSVFAHCTSFNEAKASRYYGLSLVAQKKKRFVTENGGIQKTWIVHFWKYQLNNSYCLVSAQIHVWIVYSKKVYIPSTKKTRTGITRHVRQSFPFATDDCGPTTITRFQRRVVDDVFRYFHHYHSATPNEICKMLRTANAFSMGL